MAEEAGLFTLEDVIDRISDKMERRHPHIFGDAEHGGHHLWEIIKAEERAANPDKSALAGVALALPALERAAKLQRRAARVGFDWPDVSGPRAKIDEELAELDAETEHDGKLEELGDLLFAVVNLARHLNVEPEAALREANRKFERRFRAIEQAPGFEDLSLDEKEALWVAPRRLRPTPSPETVPNCRAKAALTSPFHRGPTFGRALRRANAARQSCCPRSPIGG